MHFPKECAGVCAARALCIRPFRDGFSSHSRLLVWNGGGRDHLAVQHVCNLGAISALIELPSVQPGGLQVDLTLRLNVLAVAAAILFVGAILVGAF